MKAISNQLHLITSFCTHETKCPFLDFFLQSPELKLFFTSPNLSHANLFHKILIILSFSHSHFFTLIPLPLTLSLSHSHTLLPSLRCFLSHSSFHVQTRDRKLLFDEVSRPHLGQDHFFLLLDVRSHFLQPGILLVRLDHHPVMHLLRCAKYKSCIQTKERRHSSV